VRNRIVIGEIVAKKPDPPPDNPEQSARFEQAAIEAQADASGKAFARAFKKVVPTKKRNKRGSG